MMEIDTVPFGKGMNSISANSVFVVYGLSALTKTVEPWLWATSFGVCFQGASKRTINFDNICLEFLFLNNKIKLDDPNNKLPR